MVIQFDCTILEPLFSALLCGMILLVQCVNHAKVLIGTTDIKIQKGLLVYACVEKGDTEDQLKKLASKLVRVRVFPNENGRIDYSVHQLGLEILLVPQFTLLANTQKGLRPGFEQMPEHEDAKRLFECFFNFIVEVHTCRVQKGLFGANMMVEANNIGPSNYLIRS